MRSPTTTSTCRLSPHPNTLIIADIFSHSPVKAVSLPEGLESSSCTYLASLGSTTGTHALALNAMSDESPHEARESYDNSSLNSSPTLSKSHKQYKNSNNIDHSLNVCFALNTRKAEGKAVAAHKAEDGSASPTSLTTINGQSFTNQSQIQSSRRVQKNTNIVGGNPKSKCSEVDRNEYVF
jgi:hypothetical protein